MEILNYIKYKYHKMNIIKNTFVICFIAIVIYMCILVCTLEVCCMFKHNTAALIALLFGVISSNIFITFEIIWEYISKGIPVYRLEEYGKYVAKQ